MIFPLDEGEWTLIDKDFEDVYATIKAEEEESENNSVKGESCKSESPMRYKSVSTASQQTLTSSAWAAASNGEYGARSESIKQLTRKNTRPNIRCTITAHIGGV